MRNTDVFTGLSWGNLDRYKVRHEQTLCKEQANLLDRRILEIASGTQNYDWARRTLEFCEKDAAVGNKILQYCQEAFRLADLKKTAQSLIQQEKDRIAADNLAKAQAIDETIAALVNAERTKYWCKEVKAVERDVAALSREVRLLLRKLSQLEKLSDECAQMLLTEETEEKLRKMLSMETKGDSWLRGAEKYVKAKPGDPLIKPVRDKELLANLTKEYWRVFHAPVVKLFSGVLAQVEGGQWKQASVRVQFLEKDKDLKKLHIKLDDYVPGFTSRWNHARTLVDAEILRLEEEQKEQARQAQICADKADLHKYLVCLSKIENGKATDPNLRNEYRNLSKQVPALKYNPDSYEENFRARWKTAADTVAAAQKADDDAAAAARKAAQDKANREDLQRFVTCLKEIENNGAGKEQTQSKYDRLNTDLSKLSYEPNNYEDNFRARWKVAGEKVKQAKKDAQAAAEAAQRAKEQALAEQASKAIALEAKAARREEVSLYFRWVFSMLIAIGATFFGVYATSSYGVWWYSPMIIACGAMMYSRMWQQTEDDMYEYPHVLMQILFYLASIGIPLFFQQGIGTMIVAAGLVALVFNAYPRLTGNLSGTSTFFKTLSIPLWVLLFVLFMEKLLPNLIDANKWNMLWFCPVVFFASMSLFCAAMKFNGSDDGILVAVLDVLIGILIFIRALAILFSVMAFSFGMLLFCILLLAALIITYFIGMGIFADYLDL